MRNQKLLQEMHRILPWNRSREFYANKLNISLSKVDKLIEQVKTSRQLTLDAEAADHIAQLEDRVVSLTEDIQNNKGELLLECKNEIKTLDELIAKTNIDTKKWKIDKYVQNYWGNGKNPHWQVKAWLSVKTKKEEYEEAFLEYVKSQPKFGVVSLDVSVRNRGLDKALLIINKQDFHFDKHDVDGDNDIKGRFSRYENLTDKVLRKAVGNYRLEKIIYIVGGDQFNSEWTAATTKGTPQVNAIGYHDGFEAVIGHEVEVIQKLASVADEVEVMYIPGNHDEYVGWHMIREITHLFKKNKRITFDTKPDYSKCIRYSNTGMMFNHGDGAKPEQLAKVFPSKFKAEWSKCDYWYVFAGDKHRPMEKDFGGIEFFGIPSLSPSKSKWDAKMAHEGTKAKYTAFIIKSGDGMTDVYKEPIKK